MSDDKIVNEQITDSVTERAQENFVKLELLKKFEEACNGFDVVSVITTMNYFFTYVLGKHVEASVDEKKEMAKSLCDAVIEVIDSEGKFKALYNQEMNGEA